MNRILCIGDACSDIVLPYGQARLTNQNVDIEICGGGTVANSASGLGKLGCSVAFLGTAGTDSYGYKLKDELIKDGVDCSYFKLKSEYPTCLVLAVLDENNDRFNFLLTRENAAQTKIFPEDLDDSLLEQFDIIHTSGMVLFENPAAEAISNFLEKAKKKGLITSLDINLRIETYQRNREYIDKAIENTNYLFASSDDELIPLSGINDAKKAAMSFVREDRIVISREGSKGSTVYTTEKSYHQDSFKVNVVDTLGAGDNYNCGFIYGLIHRCSLEECNRYGCATAAINLTRKGARNCPNEQQLLEFLKQH